MFYQTEFIITDNQVGLHQEVKPSLILDLFQTVGSMHAEKLGLSSDFLLERGKCWVLARVKYEYYKVFNKHEKVIVKTWPHQEGKIDYDRDYLIEDLAGNLLVKGSTKWLIIDINTRKIVRTDDFHYPEKAIPDKNFDSLDRIRIDTNDFK